MAITLDEAWKKAYADYLEEEESSIDSTLIELIESQNDILKGYQYIAEYFEYLPVDEVESLKEDDNTVVVGAASEKNTAAKNEKDPTDIVNFLMKQLGTKLINSDSDVKRDIPSYKIEGIPTIERISDMKFPKNIIFFVQQLIAWIKRVVVYFIEKIKNVFRVLIGRTDEVKELNPEALKLQLSKVRKLETMDSFIPNKESGKLEVVKAVALRADDVKPYYALKEAQNMEQLEEDFLGLGGTLKDVFVEKKPDITKTPVVVTVDVSKDLLSLKELVQHFYDLYDGAFGSNNEHLFTTEDLSIILSLFKSTIAGIKAGNVSTVEVGSYAVEVSAIDASRIKENLIRTNTNIENLKNAYKATSEKIKDITKIVTHKELLMLNSYGIDKQWLSSATYEQMIQILGTIKPRLKAAGKSEKQLNAMKTQYEKVSAELSKLQNVFLTLGNVSYTSVYQRRIIDLCNAAKFMTQITTLRLTALGLYIKELKDIRDLLKAVSNVSNIK